MSRAYICGRCGNRRATDAKRGPVPKLCDSCKLVLAQPAPPVPQSWTPPPPPPAPALAGPVPSPWNTAPPVTPAPVPDPEVVPPPPPPPYEPGPLEVELKAELEAMRSVNPMRSTLAGLALKIARAADMADPGDLKATLAAGKELRSVLADLAKTQGGDDDDDDDETPFGSSAPEVVHAPAV